MKKLIFCMLAVVVTVSCRKAITQQQGTTENRLENANWKISKFVLDDKDKTTDFRDYQFTFETDGSVSAELGDLSYTGDWSVSVFDNGDNPDIIHLNIYFPQLNQFLNLNAQWKVENQVDNRFNLKDNNENSLVLVKI